MEPCNARLADGVVCESGSAAPPPPPNGGVSVLPPPVPPPPPLSVTSSLRIFIGKEIRPRTEAVCLSGLVDSDLSKLCLEFAAAMARANPVDITGTFVPFCEPEICWHSCGSASNTDIDSFETCRGTECADTPCLEFLLRECPAQTHAVIQRLSTASCSYVGPSPPSPPGPPPAPPEIPSPPLPPPPPASNHGTLRIAAEELPHHADCAPVTYSACERAAQELHQTNPNISPNLELSQASCEGVEAEAASCFVGCALGNDVGVPALYTFQMPGVTDQFRDFMSFRCVDNLEHPLCLCGAGEPPPPPYYDSRSVFSVEYSYAGQEASGTYEAQPTGFYKPVAVDSVLPSEFVTSGPHTFDCRGQDDGASTCTRQCAKDLLSALRAFQIVATPLPPSPPPPRVPPLPPGPPPSPSPPLSEYRFHGATESCVTTGTYTGDECRDGGVGSIFPPVCQYGTQESTFRPHTRTPHCARAAFTFVPTPSLCAGHQVRPPRGRGQPRGYRR